MGIWDDIFLEEEEFKEIIGGGMSFRGLEEFEEAAVEGGEGFVEGGEEVVVS